jgi:flagellar L-ring protein FlgH
MRRLHLPMLFLLATLPCSAALADSLYNEASFRPFVADARALRVGDNLTVVVTEFASVTTTARTSTDKDASLNGTIAGTNSSRSGSIAIGEDFTGGGRIERSGRLVAQLTVVVQAIDANGDLHIKGQQDITLNNELQTLSVEGRVRQQDIGANNTVLSTRLSDSKITYVGDGLLAEKQRPGILTRLLSWLRVL